MPLDAIMVAIRQNRPLPDRTVAITIDDAFLSVYREAWPRLRAAGLPFTLFVATDAIDKELAGYMSWDQLRELAAGGVTIGSQTRSHPHMPRLDDGANHEELRYSSQRFLSELGRRPTLFAYPYGEYGTDVQKVVTEAGFVAAFGQHSGALSPQDDLYGLPRWAMNERYGDLQRFRMAVNALPFRVSDVTPPDRVIRRNPPAFGFTLQENIGNADQIACYSSHHGGPVRLERLGDVRFEVRLDGPFPPGRARINCTVPGPDQRWRWLGVQFYVPRR
jgi:peptidoglycan/xylan/chitin deacetylase (PgdA/CDA1 family)